MNMSLNFSVTLSMRFCVLTTGKFCMRLLKLAVVVARNLVAVHGKMMNEIIEGLDDSVNSC